MRLGKEFHITGRVQGVGFRWTAKNLAEDLKISGWVRNNADGSVSLAIAGEEKKLKEFLEKLDARLGRYIEDMEVRDTMAEEMDDAFSIRHCVEDGLSRPKLFDKATERTR